MPDIPPRRRTNRGLLALAGVGVLVYCGYLGWQSTTSPAPRRARVARYRRNLPPGHPLVGDDLVEDESYRPEQPGQLAGLVEWGRRSTVVGHATRRAVEEGELVRRSDLAPPAIAPALPAPPAGADPGPVEPGPVEVPTSRPGKAPAPVTAADLLAEAMTLTRRNKDYQRALVPLRRLLEAPHHATPESFKARVLIPLCEARLAASSDRARAAERLALAADRLAQVRRMRTLRAWADAMAPELDRFRADLGPP